MNLSSNVTYIIKVINAGDYGVGKTSLAIRYTQNRFESSYLPTLGVDFYSKVVSVGEDSKIKVVVFDTVVEDFPDWYTEERPWRKGSNPKTAVFEFLKTTDRFMIDKDIENKLLITVTTDGFLKCTLEIVFRHPSDIL